MENNENSNFRSGFLAGLATLFRLLGPSDGTKRVIVSTLLAEVRGPNTEGSAYFARYLLVFQRYSAVRTRWEFFSETQCQRWVSVRGPGRSERFALVPPNR